jgi:protein-S-isoprenylcysteine O-methyltransferase Ste14
LIRSGPYAVVRHPIYTGMTLAVCGSALGFGELRHLIAVPILLTAFRLKQLSEEGLLLQSFGEKYRTYRCAVRWAIIPFVL